MPAPSGPTARPGPELLAHMLIAWVRSCGSVKAWLTTARGDLGCDEDAGGIGGERGQAADDEEDHTGHEEEPTADQVAKGAGAEDKAGDHKAVGAGDPQDLGRGGVQVGQHARQSTDGGGDVDEGQHRADADDCKGPVSGQTSPAARCSRGPYRFCRRRCSWRPWDLSGMSGRSARVVRGWSGRLVWLVRQPRRGQAANRLSFRICLSKARQGTTRRKVLTRAAVEPAG